MAVYYLDTSAIVKRYVREKGTILVVHLTDANQRHYLWSASIACVEVVAALSRRVASGSLTATQGWNAEQEFRKDLNRLFRTIDLFPNILAHAMALTKLHSLRAFDAIHLATAVDYQVRRKRLNALRLTFLSADQALEQAALAEGLLVDDPNRYP